jgi:hypothetical protein
VGIPTAETAERIEALQVKPLTFEGSNILDISPQTRATQDGNGRPDCECHRRISRHKEMRAEQGKGVASRSNLAVQGRASSD